MKSLPLAEIWSRAVADEPITTFEEFKLTSALESAENPGLRRQLLRDEQISGLLISLGHCAVAEDEFVARLSRRLQPAAPGDFTNRISLSADRRPGAETAPLARLGGRSVAAWNGVSEPSDQVVQPVSSRVADSTLDAGTQVIAGGGRGRHPSWRQRAAIGGAIAVALLLGIATGFLVRGDRSATVPDDSGSVADRLVPGSSRPASARDAKSRPDSAQPGQQPQPVPQQNQQAGDLPADGTIARLNASPGADWEAPPPDRLKAGVVKLRGGAASLEFDNGATVRLQGPAEFELVSAGEATLRRGHLSATVPPRAVGFTINTPAGRIIDLGTEFDVDVSRNGSTHVSVGKGRVKVIPQGATDPAEHRELTAGDRLTLAPPAARPRAAAGRNIGRPRRQLGNAGVNGPIVRGIKFINGRRFEYNSQEELEELENRFPELRGKGRSNRSPAPQQQRLQGRGDENRQSSATSPNQPSSAATKQAAAKKKKLYGIDWHPEMKGALSQASKNGRPVMVLRVLGNLSGFM